MVWIELPNKYIKRKHIVFELKTIMNSFAIWAWGKLAQISKRLINLLKKETCGEKKKAN